MKKIVALLAVILLVFTCVFALSACESDGLTLYVPDGAPALSVANIIKGGKIGNSTVKTVITTGEDVVAKCASGEAAFAVLPTNAAVKICSERNDYLLFSVNVYGVLYVVGTEHIDSLSELQGQTMYSIGLGNTPEFVFKAVCDAQGVSYAGNDGINVKYEADASTIIPQLLDKNSSVKFALIGEPAVTQLQNKAASQGKTVEMLFDLQKLWQDVTGSDEVGYPQASMIVKKDLLTDEFAEQLSATLAANAEFVTDHSSELNGILRGAGSSLDLNYTAELLARCNLRAIPALQAKEDIELYLSTFQAMAKFLPLSDDVIYEAKD